MNASLNRGIGASFQTLYHSSQRAREVEFAIPHELIYHEMFIRRGRPPLHSLADLAANNDTFFMSVRVQLPDFEIIPHLGIDGADRLRVAGVNKLRKAIRHNSPAPDRAARLSQPSFACKGMPEDEFQAATLQLQHQGRSSEFVQAFVRNDGGGKQRVRRRRHRAGLTKQDQRTSCASDPAAGAKSRLNSTRSVAASPAALRIG